MSYPPEPRWAYLPRQTSGSYQPSIAVRLRETQAALATSQADLTAMERERDEARASLKEMAELRADAVDQAARVARVRDLVQAELTTARTELEQLRRGLGQAS